MLRRVTPYLEKLDKMIGMESLKESIFYQVIYYLQRMNYKCGNEEYLNTIIMGSPGTGKTTVAKIIARIYQSLEVLSLNGPFRVAHRDDFIAEYLGQTAIKTTKLLKSCIGGVLFIDEVYSLAPMNKDSDSFSKEALDTLTAFLSEHKHDFCCIAAGYKDDIYKCFFNMNSGLERRFPWVHIIEPYSTSHLIQMFRKMLGDIEWDLNLEQNELENLFNSNKDLFKNAGGDVETFISKTKMVHSRRVFNLDQTQKFIITLDDCVNAIKFIRKNNKINENDDRPNHMYT
jgi:stage V sporulation protein K